MPTFIVIPPIGEITELKCGDSEREIWHAIKGVLNDAFLECVTHTAHPNMCVYLDEEAKLRPPVPPPNPRATALVPDLMPGDYIAGTAVFVGRKGSQEVDCPLSLDDLNALPSTYFYDNARRPMIASCEHGHTRTPMERGNLDESGPSDVFICPECKSWADPVAIHTIAREKLGGPLAGSGAIADYLTNLAETEVEGVISADGTLSVEYPEKTVETESEQPAAE
jgi:hypothetical protein